MATVIDVEPGPDGVFRELSDAERIAADIRRGMGAVEEFVETGRSIRNALSLMRQSIRRIGKTTPNPRRRLRNPEAVVDAEEV